MRTALYLVTSLALVLAIAGLAALWVHLSHLHAYEGRVITYLWSTHGVHTSDLLFLGAELLLLAILTSVLLAGFTRR